MSVRRASFALETDSLPSHADNNRGSDHSRGSTPSVTPLGGNTYSMANTASRQNIAAIIKSALGEGTYTLNPGSPAIQRTALENVGGQVVVVPGRGSFMGALNNQSAVQSQKKSSNAGTSFRTGPGSVTSLTGVADEFIKFKDGGIVTWTLTFRNIEDEIGYQQFFVTRTLRAWRSTILSCIFGYLVVYVYAIVKYPSDALVWNQLYKDKSIDPSLMSANMQAYCPKGSYFCANCPENIICSDYYQWQDGLFLISVLLPGIFALLASYLLPRQVFNRYYHCISAWFVSICGIIGIILRFRMIEPSQNPLLPTVMLIFLLNSTFHGLQIRFIHSAVVLATIFTVWVILNTPDYSGAHQTSINNSFISGLALISTSILIVFGLRRSEKFYRDQFLRGQHSNKVNKKLIDQLKSLQQSYSTGAVDFETPLEKSMAVLRSLMSDPTLTSEQFHSLQLVLQLLNSPQLLTPDFEGQLGEQEESQSSQFPKSPTQLNLGLDQDTRAWLFSEISKKRGDSHRRQSIAVAKRKRKSTAIQSTVYDSPGDEIPALPSKPTLYDSVNISRDKLKYDLTSRPSEDGSSLSGSQAVVSFNDPFQFALNKTSLLSSHHSETVALGFISDMIAIPRPKQAKTVATHNSTTVQTLLAQVGDWNWKLFDFSEACPGGKPLYILAHHLFSVNGLFEEFEIPVDKFSNMMWKVQQGYHHNSMHAADVLHAVNYFIQYDQISAIMAPLDLLAMFFAAAIHDYDHPGVNNTFLAATTNGLSVLYNDKSVLESYHLSSAFSLLYKSEFNFLSQLPKADQLSFRDSVIDMVLATDLSQHYSTLSQFKTRLQNNFNPGQTKEDRSLLFRMMIKCSDVSNPTKEFSLYSKWTNLVLDEWRTQGDIEKKMNIPVSPFMDRDNPNVLVSSQAGFIDFIIVPMFESVHNGFLKIPNVMDELERNRAHWQKLKDVKDGNTPISPNLTQVRLTSNADHTEHPGSAPGSNPSLVVRKPTGEGHAMAAKRSMTVPTSSDESVSSNPDAVTGRRASLGLNARIVHQFHTKPSSQKEPSSPSTLSAHSEENPGVVKGSSNAVESNSRGRI